MVPGKRRASVVYQVAKGADDTWRMQTLLVSDKLDELERIAPFVLSGPMEVIGRAA